MQEIGIVITGLDGISAFEITIEGFETDGIHDAVLDAVIDYLYNQPSRRKIFKMLEPVDHAVFSILTNFGEVVDVYIEDIQPIWDDSKDIEVT